MRWLLQMLAKAPGPVRRRGGLPEDALHVDTELMRRRRELARYQGQVGDNLTVQTTIDMARTQTWTGGGKGRPVSLDKCETAR